ncbi:acyl-CoA dehydrogenase family protein [Thermodesulfobacteriota bacterium]
MDLDLSDEHLSLRQSVREFAEKEIWSVAGDMDEKGECSAEVLSRMAGIGLLGMRTPKEYGGIGADMLSYAVAAEELGRADVSTAMIMEVTNSLVCYPLRHFGTEDQKQEWLAPVAQGRILGAFGLTEPGAGSDAAATSTSAVLEGDHWVINGNKQFISLAGAEQTAFVIAIAATGKRDDGKKELSTIIVPKGSSGYTMSAPNRKLGVRALDNRQLYFDSCRVPAENLLGQRGAGLRQLLAALDEGRIAYAAIAVGAAQRCLDMASKYAKDRLQFGRPLFEFQALQFRLVDMAVSIEHARLMCWKAAFLADNGRPYTKEAAMAKLFATEMATRAVETAIQVHGGYGYMEENPLCRFYRDIKLFSIGEGSSEIQRLVIARYV